MEKIEGRCIRCELAMAAHISGWNGDIGYGWCDRCFDIINAEDARGLAAGDVDADGHSFLEGASE